MPKDKTTWQHFGDEGELKVEATCSSCKERVVRGLLSNTRIVLCADCAGGLLKAVWNKPKKGKVV